jgi:hypothetical protein
MSSLYTLKENGYLKMRFSLPSSWREFVKNEDYERLYQEAQKEMLPNGVLGEKLFEIYQECRIEKAHWELMLAKRVGPQDPEEDGIWHDDGSRNLAFSLSLNEHPDEISGGELYLRPKDRPLKVTQLSTLPWGEGYLFATGKLNWEHRISLVSSGNRLVLVAWVTDGNEGVNP